MYKHIEEMMRRTELGKRSDLIRLVPEANNVWPSTKRNHNKLTARGHGHVQDVAVSSVPN